MFRFFRIVIHWDLLNLEFSFACQTLDQSLVPAFLSGGTAGHPAGRPLQVDGLSIMDAPWVITNHPGARGG